MIDIIVPHDVWEDDSEGVIVTWLYDSGATITEGKPICEVMVEKAQSDILAPANGILTIIEDADAVVVKGQLIGKIEPS
ncbi:MAG: pyruvate/2-oxoglutarate dehydrogenase complex dihydrolipoamide acyltransferase (E2) component [Pseudoalteromonas tetraodonis]|jgi:pyruvate/2-oxoglutarate dehydrogenase complex dihydrolipoamide acyltransferase (E2) component